MLILLALPVLVAVAAMHRYLHFYAPSNLLVRRVRAQKPRWRTASVLVAVAGVVLVLMHTVAGAVANGAPGWLNLVVLILAWDAIKVSMLTVSVCSRCVVRLFLPSTATLSPYATNRVEA